MSGISAISTPQGGYEALLSVVNLKKWFPVSGGLLGSHKRNIKAVDGVSFSIQEGKTLGLVGESGCGKSTVGRSVLRLLEPTSGEIIFHGKNLIKKTDAEMREVRKQMQIIFQDPYSALNPRMTIGDIVAEPLFIHKLANKSDAPKRVKQLLNMVGVSQESMGRFPHEFSGGQRQRICIARVLAVNPELIICDESVSALDVSIQAQILNLLLDLQNELKVTYLFISHNLSVVKHVSDHVAVMYLGKIVEIAEKQELYRNPMHPYTKVLLSAVPVPDPDVKVKRIILKGDVPSPMNPPSGCAFHTRCPMAFDKCHIVVPECKVLDNGHMYMCHI